MEAKIILSGLPKGDYYRKAILGQEVAVTAGSYMSNRVAKVLEQILEHLKNGNTEDEKLLLEQEKIATLLDKMKNSANNSYAEINRYKKEIGTLKTVLRSYVVQIDSLNQLNQKLTQENTEVRKQMSWVRERNQKLENQQKRHERSHCKSQCFENRKFRCLSGK